jgi:hypothetical protein
MGPARIAGMARSYGWRVAGMGRSCGWIVASMARSYGWRVAGMGRLLRVACREHGSLLRVACVPRVGAGHARDPCCSRRCARWSSAHPPAYSPKS